jgi:hypothetical protein
MYPIRIVKMLSGETLIAGIAETGGVYTLERPMSVSLVPAPNSKGNKQETMVFLKNWIDFTNDEMYIIPKNMVMCISMPDVVILQDYNDAKIKFDMLEAEEDLGPMVDDDDDEGEELGEDEDDGA